MKSFDIKAGMIMIAVCSLIGAAIQHFTGFSWLTATLLIMAAFMVNGLAIFNEDLDKDGFDYQEGVTDTIEAKKEQRKANLLQVGIIVLLVVGALWSHI
jgi:hypothetical protein